MGAVSKPKPRNRRQMKVIITVVILVPILCLAVVASIGAWQYNQTKAVSLLSHQIKFAQARFEVDVLSEPPPSFQALLDSGMIEEMPVSPVDGRPMHVMQPGSTDFVGGVSYFIYEQSFHDGDQDREGAIVCYHTAPSVFEVAWSWLAYPFIDQDSYEYRWYRLWPYSTKPALIWLGGECGNNHEWLSRGLTPEQVRDELQRLEDDYLATSSYSVISRVIDKSNGE